MTTTLNNPSGTLTASDNGDTIIGTTSADLTIDAGVTIKTKVGNATAYNLADGTTLTDDGTLNLVSTDQLETSDGSDADAEIIVGPTGTLSIGNGFTVSDAGQISFGDTAGGTVQLQYGENTSILDSVGNIQSGDNIDLVGVTATNYTISSDGQGDTFVALTNNGATTASFELSGLDASVTGFSLSSSPNGVSLAATCFAAGTRLATPDGEIKIEHLAVGDLVSTLDGAKPVVWIGHRSVALHKLPTSDAARLVRVRQGGFSDNVPHRDLWITPEHCIFWEGKLIPARMLVNGRSVIIDRTVNSFTYYHVELEQHGILIAEGLTTESYLDTGNRSNFANAPVVAIQPGSPVDAHHVSWATDAAAPLTVDRASVEPVWQMLSDRAAAQGFGQALPAAEVTSDPRLRLVTADGTTIRALREHQGRHTFLVPAGASGLRLLSRTGRPSETVGPFVDDRRALGVLVGEVAVWNRRNKTVLTTHLDREELAGWFAPEAGAYRWTKGDAALPMEANARPVMVEIEVVTAGPYLADVAAPAEEFATTTTTIRKAA